MTRDDRTMKRVSWPVYLTAAGVALASFAFARWMPIPDIFRGIAVVPGAGALLVFLGQVVRDALAHERQRALQVQQQDFRLGVASRMAEVVFEKHVAFCEAYLARVAAGMIELTGTGPRQEALGLASDLARIRIQYGAWISSDVEARVLPLEKALRKIGATAGVLESVPVGERRSRLVQEMYDAYGIVLGVQSALTEEEAQTAASRVFERLRELLGIQELTTLRQRAVREAISRTADEGR